MMIKILTFIALIACSCMGRQYVKDVVIKKISEEQLVKIKLDEKYAMQKIEVTENSANDTFMIGIMKVPPGKTGKLYDIEFFNNEDSMVYKIFPYKAP